MNNLFTFLFAVFSSGVIHCLPAGDIKQQQEVLYIETEKNNDTYTQVAEYLNEALAGLGTNEEVIVNIITNHTNAERQSIAKAYYKKYGKDLIKDLKDDLSGDLEDLIVALMLEPYKFLAKELHKSLSSFITDDSGVAQILCTRSRTELKPLMNTYELLYNKTIKSDIEEYLDGDEAIFLKEILTEKIRQDNEINQLKSREQFNIIPNKKHECEIHQNRGLMDLLSKESFMQLHYTFVVYEKEKQKSVDYVLDRWCEDPLLLEAYKTVVRFAVNPNRFYAEHLRKAVMGVGTDDRTLIRIIVSRSEIDLPVIKEEYKNLYNTTLSQSISSETSWGYKKALLKILNEQ